MSRTKLSCFVVLLTIFALAAVPFDSLYAQGPSLKRTVPSKQYQRSVAARSDAYQIVFKLSEGIGQPELSNRAFPRSGPGWESLNEILESTSLVQSVRPLIGMDKETLARLRQEGSRRLGRQLPDMTLYYEITAPQGTSLQSRRSIITRLLSLDIVEVVYFCPPAELATAEIVSATPNWEAQQYYLQAAPTGLNAYYGWGFAGGRGEDVLVIDIEGNWNETHEDLHGGTDTWHIAGRLINDPAWLNHGTAVLGEIAADSNSFGMTGISHNVDLGTVSVGSLSTTEAILTASAHADVGDIILIELQREGPNNGAYVALEYWDADFNAILTASSLGQIVVEAAANGNQDYDDTSIYDSLFYPDYRFSGAIMVGASCSNHLPASFTNYGIRVDVHGYGCWDVYTLGYGNLYGTTDDDSYTYSFSGTSSASPMIVGACAILQGIYKNMYALTLDHDGLRTLLKTYSTPQAPHYKHIGPMPDLLGSCNEITGYCCGQKGDADHNGQLDILDIDYLINWLYRSGPEPSCMDEADADNSGQADVLDIDFLINYLYRSGAQPGPCQ